MRYEKIAYICSALKGDIETNRQKAISYCRYAVLNGFVPYAPHVLFTEFMDDDIPGERHIAMDMSDVMLRRADELWVFSEDYCVSERMRREISLAQFLKIPVDYFIIRREDINSSAFFPVIETDPRSSFRPSGTISVHYDFLKEKES